jgi:hypothetical protein
VNTGGQGAAPAVRWSHGQRSIAVALMSIPVWVWVGLAAFGILFLRRPDVLTNAQFYAEDGPIFYLGALLDGASSLVRSYAGYLHLVPRLVALLEAAAPVAWAPTVANTISFVIAAGIAAYVASDRLTTVLRGRWLRVTAALTFVLLPATHEVFGTMTNVQWLLGIYLVLAVAQTDPVSRLQAATDRIALAAASLTGPMSIVIAPLHLVRLAKRRDRTSAWQAAAVSIAALIQAFVLSRSGRPVSLASQPDLLTMGKVAIYRAIVVPLAGVHHGASLKLLGLPHPLVVLGAVIALGAVVAVLRRMGAGGWLAAYLIVAFTGLAFVATQYPATVFLDPWAGARYFFLSGAMVAGCSFAVAWQARGVSRLAAIGGLAVLIVGITGDFTLPPRDLHGWVTSSSCINGLVPCDVPIDRAGKWTIHWPGRP